MISIGLGLNLDKARFEFQSGWDRIPNTPEPTVPYNTCPLVPSDETTKNERFKTSGHVRL